VRSRARFGGRWIATAACLAALLWAPRQLAAASESLDLGRAEALAMGRGDPQRDRALKLWAQRAPLAELLYVLRRSPAELGASEALLVSVALDRTPADRPALRRRLAARLALVAPPRRSRRSIPGTSVPSDLVVPVRASVFRIAVLLPDSGGYQGFGRALLAGLEVGLKAGVPTALLPELQVWGTGEEQPGRAVAALDSAARTAGVAVGELLSVPTLVIAAGARFLGIPVVSPTATDESIGTLGPMVFQVGPSGYERGARLADFMLAKGPRRVGILSSSSVAQGSLATGFATAAEGAGSPIVWQKTYPPGTTNFRDDVRALTFRGIELLLWDGEAREAEALVRQLAKDRVSLKICGGQALAPQQFHAATRVLLEGVQYVGDEWVLPAPTQALLDSAATERGGERAGPLHVRGYLAGRAIRDAVSSGALCPEEIAASIASRVGSDVYLRARGFLDTSVEGAELPIYVVRRGASVRAQ